MLEVDIGLHENVDECYQFVSNKDSSSFMSSDSQQTCRSSDSNNEFSQRSQASDINTDISQKSQSSDSNNDMSQRSDPADPTYVPSNSQQTDSPDLSSQLSATEGTWLMSI